MTNIINKTKRALQVISFLVPSVLLIATIVQYSVTINTELRTYRYTIQNPIHIEPRVEPLTVSVIKKAEAAPVNPATLSTEDYISYVFGKDAKLALAISQAENGTRQCDRVGINKNNTLDLGVFQINTVHLKKGWKLTELLDCHKNIDYAYQIFQAQGFTPWVTFQTKAYAKFLK